MSDEQSVRVTVTVTDTTTTKTTETVWVVPQIVMDLIRHAGEACESFSKLKDAELREVNKRLQAVEALTNSGNGEKLARENEELRKKVDNQATHINHVTEKLKQQNDRLRQYESRRPWREKGAQSSHTPVVPTTQVTTETHNQRSEVRGHMKDSKINTQLQEGLKNLKPVVPTAG